MPFDLARFVELAEEVAAPCVLMVCGSERPETVAELKRLLKYIGERLAIVDSIGMEGGPDWLRLMELALTSIANRDFPIQASIQLVTPTIATCTSGQKALVARSYIKGEGEKD